MNSANVNLYDPAAESSACGVGFITRKDGRQDHDVIARTHQALCAIPHRGGMSAEGVGDGAGVSVDLSVDFFGALVGKPLQPGSFGVGNFFLPQDDLQRERAHDLVTEALQQVGLQIELVREVPVASGVLRPTAVSLQFPVWQWVFTVPEPWDRSQADRAANTALLTIERQGYADPALQGLYPLSLSVRTQVLKGRLNAHEVVPYFQDLVDPRHKVRTCFFHTRFSTNTEPHPAMAQPFRLLAHNGELNTDRKNRLSDETAARAQSRSIVRPPGQSDSSRLDQTLTSRVFDDELDLVEAVVSLMPPAWENDASLAAPVREMLEYFSLYEEKNDGPAAVIFSDGDVVGARLDRLGLRPLRTLETAEYLVVSSEAGQVPFPAGEVTHRGRIEAGGMIHLDHRTGRVWRTQETLTELAAGRDYAALLEAARIHISQLPAPQLRGDTSLGYRGDLSLAGRYVAYNLNQESFRFMLDPMLTTGTERVSAMGYGNAINALADTEGGMVKYFSQRFAQVTNPPLDSIREADAMTMRVALGRKPDRGGPRARQIILDSPVLSHLEMVQLRVQDVVPLRRFDILYRPAVDDEDRNAAQLVRALDDVGAAVEEFARAGGGIAVLSDREISTELAPLPLVLAVASVNQRLIDAGLRLHVSLLAESGQLPSAHHVATTLGFGASAVYSLSARLRAEERFPAAPGPAWEITATDTAVERFRKATLKSLAKTMGRVGLCTVESYIGGEFFEPNYLDTRDPVLSRCFPHLDAPVGGVGFKRIAAAATAWHHRATTVTSEQDVPLLGLFKERADGAGHSYGLTAVRGFAAMTDEPTVVGESQTVASQNKEANLHEAVSSQTEPIQHAPGRANLHEAVSFPDRLPVDLAGLTLDRLQDSFGLTDEAYQHTGFEELTAEQIDAFTITTGYRDFVAATSAERSRRPSALRDVLALPGDLTGLSSAADMAAELGRFLSGSTSIGNNSVLMRGLTVEHLGAGRYRLSLTDSPGAAAAAKQQRCVALGEALTLIGGDLTWKVVADTPVSEPAAAASATQWVVEATATGLADAYLALLRPAPPAVPLDQVQPAHEITRTLASGAMSHGALVASAHEAVAHGTNMVGGLSNCGEGGEHYSRYATIRGSRIKQLASGRFGVWAGYLADPMLQELEIKIGQGAKPGEGGQLPAAKVTVDIAAARGGTPGIELISPPPHHDTYSIEDLAQLIHDCKAARVKVVVKLVSSEGIGTIAVGVAKAGADVINVAGNTGGTGAASVTSLKYAGRSAEIGVAEVHQALVANGLRDKVTLRCSGAHQTGSDVVTSALLGGDSFEFGTTALMMLRCVMAKNCNIKCPAGLTTNPEVFAGGPRALAQYLLNIAHDVRTILAGLGLCSLREARGRADLLQLLDHPAAVGRLDVRALLTPAHGPTVTNPVYLEKDYQVDDTLFAQVQAALVERAEPQVQITDVVLTNSTKTVGGQLAIDLERLLNYQLSPDVLGRLPAAVCDPRGRWSLRPDAVTITSTGTAGQSYGAFANDGMNLHHTGTANDGVAKSLSGGRVAVCSPGGGSNEPGGNVLIGNFALFGATGGRLFVQGQAGDRFAVRNSGATAVVEGVGDFACEYMTNGAVLNLGEFGKGLGNGMSGGFLYQYDPHNRAAAGVSADSVFTFPITDTTHGDFHSEAVHQLLVWHVQATQSPLAQHLLDTWPTARHQLVCAMPRALLLYQDAAAILADKDRKTLLDEVARAIAVEKVRAVKLDYRDQRQILGGRVPSPDPQSTHEVFALLATYTVLAIAQDVARERVPHATGPQDPSVQQMVRTVVLTEDHAVMLRVQRYLRAALEPLTDHELAGMVSAKRLEDYLQSLRMRNMRTFDGIGTYGWIAEQQRRNARLLEPGRLDEILSTAALADLARLADMR